MKTSHRDADAFLTQDEISTAIGLLIARMGQIDACCADGFPLYSLGTQDRWIVSPGGSWVGGFWAGCWWLRARVTQSVDDRNKAAQICQRMSSKIQSKSINRAMIFWYGAALGDLYFDDAGARLLARQSATALAASFDPAVQCIPVGTDMGGGADGNRRISLDSLASVIGLLGHGNDPHAEAIARMHTDTALAACGGADGAFHSEALCGQAVFHSDGQAGTWSRGQAWAMLGLSRAAARWGEPYTSAARSACAYWLRSRPIGLPPNRLDQAGGPCDPSASLIAALAMLSLAATVPDGERWLTCGRGLIATLVRSDYFTGLHGQNGSAAAGIFWGACYQIRPGEQQLVESAWSSFFLIEALCILAGVIKATDC